MLEEMCYNFFFKIVVFCFNLFELICISKIILNNMFWFIIVEKFFCNDNMFFGDGWILIKFFLCVLK